MENYYDEHLEPSYDEDYDELATDNERLKEEYCDTKSRLKELSKYVKEVCESNNYEERIGELYEWCKEYKYF